MIGKTSIIAILAAILFFISVSDAFGEQIATDNPFELFTLNFFDKNDLTYAVEKYGVLEVAEHLDLDKYYQYAEWDEQKFIDYYSSSLLSQGIEERQPTEPVKNPKILKVKPHNPIRIEITNDQYWEMIKHEDWINYQKKYEKNYYIHTTKELDGKRYLLIESRAQMQQQIENESKEKPNVWTISGVPEEYLTPEQFHHIVMFYNVFEDIFLENIKDGFNDISNDEIDIFIKNNPDLVESFDLDLYADNSDYFITNLLYEIEPEVRTWEDDETDHLVYASDLSVDEDGTITINISKENLHYFNWAIENHQPVNEDGEIVKKLSPEEKQKLLDKLDIANTYSENQNNQELEEIIISELPLDENGEFQLELSIVEFESEKVYRLPDMTVIAAINEDNSDYEIAYDNFIKDIELQESREYWDSFDSDGFFDYTGPAAPSFSVSTCDGTSPFENTVGTTWGGNMVYFEYHHTFLEILASKCQYMYIPSTVTSYPILDKIIDEEIELWEKYDLPIEYIKYSHMLHAFWGDYYNGLEGGTILSELYKLNEEIKSGQVSNYDALEKAYTFITSDKDYSSYSKFWMPPIPSYYNGHAERAYESTAEMVHNNPCRIIGVYDPEYDRFVNRHLTPLTNYASALYGVTSDDCPSPREYINNLLKVKMQQWVLEIQNNIEIYKPTKLIQEIVNCDEYFLANTANWEKLEQCTSGKPNVWNDQARTNLGKEVLTSGDEGKYSKAYEALKQGEHFKSLALYADILKDENGEVNKVIAMNRGNNYLELNSPTYAAWNYSLVGQDDAVAMNAFAKVNFDIGNYETAEYMWKKSINLDSSVADAWNGLGMLYRVQEKYTEAERMYDYVLQNLNPENEDALGGLELIPRD